MTPSRISYFILFSVSIFFTDAAEVPSSSSGSGKAIYSSSPARNPISSYFKEHKNKLRPYFTRPASSDSSSTQLSSPYSQGLSIHDDTSASVQSSDLYSHSSYYDATSNPETNIYATATNNDDQHGSSSTLTDPYDSSNPDHQASNYIYAVADPMGNGYASPGGNANPGYYGGDPLHGSVYSQPPSFHGPGLPGPSHSSNGNAGYYGAGDKPQTTISSYHENSVYSSPQGSSGAILEPAGGGSSPYYGMNSGNGSPAPPPSYHHGNHAPTSNTYNNHNNLDKNNEASDNSDLLFPIPGGTGYGASDEEEEGGADHGYDYGNGLLAVDDDDMMMEFPLFGGGGGGGDTTTAQPAATDAAAPPVDNPLNFLNLVGTDFQPGRLVNIFFGLFIMLFMIITHGYALWILGIAYLPGTRSLNQWELDKDKIEDFCTLVLDAVEYWDNKIE